MDYAKAISLPELEKAAFECARGVRWKESVAKWMYERIPRLAELHAQLVSGRYKLSDYIIFRLCDPKPRIIHSTRFRDRVVQRSLCNNGLYDALTKPLIYDCGACLNGKGTRFTTGRLTAHLQQYFRENKTNKGWYLELDIKKYFDSTPHGRLKDIVTKYVTEPNFRNHIIEIIDSFSDSRDNIPGGKLQIMADPFGRRGVGLGSQISQILQLLYLSELDHMIKQKFKIKHYVRYMDDMILFHSDRDYLIDVWHKITKYLSTIGLRLNEKSHMDKIEHGFTFMKIRMTLTPTGKVKKKFSRKSFSKEIRRINTLMKKMEAGKFGVRDLLQHANTWFGSNDYKMSPKQPRIILNHLKEQYNKMIERVVKKRAVEDKEWVKDILEEEFDSQVKSILLQSKQNLDDNIKGQRHEDNIKREL